MKSCRLHDIPIGHSQRDALAVFLGTQDHKLARLDDAAISGAAMVTLWRLGTSIWFSRMLNIAARLLRDRLDINRPETCHPVLERKAHIGMDRSLRAEIIWLNRLQPVKYCQGTGLPTWKPGSAFQFPPGCLLRWYNQTHSLPSGARCGTGSPRWAGHCPGLDGLMICLHLGWHDPPKVPSSPESRRRQDQAGGEFRAQMEDILIEEQGCTGICGGILADQM